MCCGFKQKKGLMGILKYRKLYFSYSLVNLLASVKFKGIAFPMVSLSNLSYKETKYEMLKDLDSPFDIKLDLYGQK